MSTSASGRILDETGSPLAGLTVQVRFVRAVVPSLLDSTTSDFDGTFTLDYAGEDPFLDTERRHLEFRVVDRVGRVMLEDERRDVDDPTLDLGDLEIHAANASGLPVTLRNNEPAFMTTGNRIIPLVDGPKAFGKVKELYENATESIHVTQLFMSVPDDFESLPANEKPALIFDFGPPRFRPERALIDKAAQGVDVRILLNQPTLHPVVQLLLFYSLIGIIGLHKVNGQTDVRDVKSYFDDAAATNIRVRGFEQKLPDGVMHAKLVIVDGNKAVSLGSPMKQSYFDDKSGHKVANPQRGKSTGYPQHDVSVSVEGPAVADMHQVFRLHWNEDADASDQVDEVERPAALTGGDIATVQVVRTLSDRRFDDPESGEKGILEGYLRAIERAERLIYLENQYFTCDAIADALAEVIKDTSGRPDLQVIMLLNIEPDVPFYPWMQRRHITSLREAVPDTASGRKRLGVFTRWGHEADSNPRPRIVPTYVHSKVGIVDDIWATIGSANLDGLSLDANWLLSKLVLGESRATESNLLIFSGVDGMPVTSAVEALRKELFVEHLAVSEAAATTVPDGGWLELWQSQADAKLQSLKQDPTQPTDDSGHVLPFPEDGRTNSKPREQMKALGIDTTKIDPIKSVASFNLDDGSPDKRPKVDVPPQPRISPVSIP